MKKLILEKKEIELEEVFEFDTLRNMFNKSYDLKFYDVDSKIIRRFKIKKSTTKVRKR